MVFLRLVVGGCFTILLFVGFAGCFVALYACCWVGCTVCCICLLFGLLGCTVVVVWCLCLRSLVGVIFLWGCLLVKLLFACWVLLWLVFDSSRGGGLVITGYLFCVVLL